MLHLVTLFYDEKRQARRKELVDSLKENALLFDAITVVSQGAGMPCQLSCPCAWLIKDRPQTVGDLVEAGNQTAGYPDPIIVIANTDIVFKGSCLQLMREYLAPTEAWCLTRWENDVLWNVDYSQDAWCFRGKIEGLDPSIPMARPGFDNRLTHDIKRAGYTVLNPAKSARIDHRHDSRLVTSMNSQKNRVPLPYLFVKPHYIGEAPKYRRATKLPANCIRDRERAN